MVPKAASALHALTALLAPRHAVVAKAVDLAATEPDVYAKGYTARLADRFAEDDPVDPWLAMISAVTDDRIHLGVSLDWKESASEIAAAIQRVVTTQGKLRKAAKHFDARAAFAFYDEDAHLETKTLAFIDLCGRALSAHGLALVEFDLASDSYELTVIPWNDLAAAQRLARTAGGKLILRAPKTPLAKPLPAPPPKPKSPMQLDTFRFGRGLDGNKVSWRVDPNEFEQTPGFLFRYEYDTQLVDCRVWPPKITRVTHEQVDVVVHERNGARILWKTYNDQRLLWIERPGRASVDLIARLPPKFYIERALWIGDLAVFLPQDFTVGQFKELRRPLVWNGKMFAPAKGLPAAKPKSFSDNRWPPAVTRGFARTGDGVDVLIWEGYGWVVKGDGFVKKWKLLRDLDKWWLIVGAPGPGNSFYFQHRLAGTDANFATFREARDGVCRERVRFAEVVEGPLRGTFDGRVIFGVNRSGRAKTPVIGVFHPATAELTWVPPHLLGFKRDDQVDAYGVVAPTKGTPYLWVLDDDSARRIAWAAILALPRKPAAAGVRSSSTA
ncbi:MAG: hypothetical protein ABI467_29200 [Kofleriaceae bacterium]